MAPVKNIGKTKKKSSKRSKTCSYRNYETAELLNALKEVTQGNKTIYKAAKDNNIPWSTLKRYLKSNPDINKQHALIPKQGKPFALSTELEQKLYHFIIKMQELGFGLTVFQVRTLAFKLAEAVDRAHFFNENKRIASKWWWAHFQTRYNLTIRVPENLSAYRASCGNPTLIAEFYSILRKLYTKLNIDEKNLKSHVWNTDETGLQYVVKGPRVVTSVGKKYIYRRTYAERGETQTIIGCVCADGTWIPPTIIFKGIRWNELLKKDCLPNTQVKLSTKGWINADLYLEWFQFFISSVKTRPIVLLMDSHAAHITPEVIELAVKNDIHLLTFPAHTTHLLQPLDVGVYKSLKSHWAKSMTDYMTEHPHDKPNRFNFFSIFNIPFINAMSTTNIQNAFKKTGIVPLNDKLIMTEATAPSLLTDKPAEISSENAVTDNANTVIIQENSPILLNQSSTPVILTSKSSQLSDSSITSRKSSQLEKLLTVISAPKTNAKTAKRKSNPSAKNITSPSFIAKMKENQIPKSSEKVTRQIFSHKKITAAEKSSFRPKNILKPTEASSNPSTSRSRITTKTRKQTEDDWNCGSCNEL